jgi:hypothetical protein
VSNLPVHPDDVVLFRLSREQLSDIVKVAHGVADKIKDRPDLHKRDYIERFIDCLMGEIAERCVLEWLISNGKYCKSAVNKLASYPDPGHDLWLRTTETRPIHASVKSSLSVYKDKPQDILNIFKLATEPNEIREVNIQVCFWLSPNSEPRISVPSASQVGIFAWAWDKDLKEAEFSSYRGEERSAPESKLADLRSPKELLSYLS